jgi:hypothetical protein
VKKITSTSIKYNIVHNKKEMMSTRVLLEVDDEDKGSVIFGKIMKHHNLTYQSMDFTKHTSLAYPSLSSRKRLNLVC